MRTNRLLHDGRLSNGRRVDVEIADGLISAVSDSSTPPDDGTTIDDLEGWLILPALAEPHAHLDKALTAEMVPNPNGDLDSGHEAWTAAAQAGKFTHEGMVARAIHAIDLLMVHGVTAIRSHVNVGGDFGARNVAAMQEARSHFEGLVDIQLVALTVTPITGTEGSPNRAALAEAIEVGVDLIGGAPNFDTNPSRFISTALDAATDAGLGVDLQVDETLDPSSLDVLELARQVQNRGFEHQVVASHCVSLGMQTPKVQAEVAREISEAGIAVFPLPQTNLFLQGRDLSSATPRGLTALRALQDAGVLVAAGADNVQDIYNQVGRSDPLETAALLVMAGHQLADDAYRMVSNDAREGLGLARVELTPGAPADLLAINAVSPREAIADAPMSRRVYHLGELVASADQWTQVHRAD